MAMIRGIAVLSMLASVLGDSCQMSDSNKTDCKRMSEGDCQAAGCCWKPVKPNPRNLPWCYFSSAPAPSPTPAPPVPPMKCNDKIKVDDRVDCKAGDRDSCAAAGCCWKPVSPNPDNAPWCFYNDRVIKKCSLKAKPQEPFTEAELKTVQKYFEANLDIEGTGMVVAAPDHNTGPGGDYYYAWMRDGALSMNAYMHTATSFSADVSAKMEKWLAWVERSFNQYDPNGFDILTEPKFEIPSGKPYTGGWCRPQNDGPGLRAITLMDFAANKPDVGPRAWNIVKVYLDWISTNYTSNGCDLWEEVRSTDFFWNRFTMRKALVEGAKFAAHVGKDAGRASMYAGVAKTIESKLKDHVQSDGFVCEATSRCKDTAVIEAFNVGYMEDEVFGPLSKEAAATLSGLSKLFCRSYTLNVNAANAGIPGVLFGRYQGDSYAGGNPWILLTASASELLYRQAQALASGVKPDAEAKALLQELLGGEVTHDALVGAGDANLLLMKKYLVNGMHMNEQIDRNTGELKSAKDLTWNYANVLKAMKARREATSAMAYAFGPVVV